MPQNARNTPSTHHICVRLLAQLTTTSATAFQFLGTFFISATSPFHSLAGIFTTVSAHLNAGFLTVRRYFSHSARLQHIDHFNRIFASAILTLQSFLQLKYLAINDPNQSLFAAHPTTMRVAVASSAVYFLAYYAVLRFPLHRLASLAHHVLLSSGCIAVASLVAVTLPDTARPFVYVVLGSTAVAGMLYFLYRKLVAEEDEAEVSPFLEGNFSWLMRRLPV